MPISKEDFNRGAETNELKAKILAVLKANPTTAMNVMDLFSKLYPAFKESKGFWANVGVGILCWNIGTQLDQLVQEGQVVSRWIKGQYGGSERYFVAK
jgi:hypothetical protein